MLPGFDFEMLNETFALEDIANTLEFKLAWQNLRTGFLKI